MSVQNGKAAMTEEELREEWLEARRCGRVVTTRTHLAWVRIRRADLDRQRRPGESHAALALRLAREAWEVDVRTPFHIAIQRTSFTPRLRPGDRCLLPADEPRVAQDLARLTPFPPRHSVESELGWRLRRRYRSALCCAPSVQESSR